MEQKAITVDDVIDYLNTLLKADRLAVRALLINRVPCNRDLAEHPTCQVHSYQEGFMVGMMGVLNGMFETLENGWGRIGYVIEDNEIVEFRRLVPGEHNGC